VQTRGSPGNGIREALATASGETSRELATTDGAGTAGDCGFGQGKRCPAGKPRGFHPVCEHRKVLTTRLSAGVGSPVKAGGLRQLMRRHCQRNSRVARTPQQAASGHVANGVERRVPVVSPGEVLVEKRVQIPPIKQHRQRNRMKVRWRLNQHPAQAAVEDHEAEVRRENKVRSS
jgi:hypothetical protein